MFHIGLKIICFHISLNFTHFICAFCCCHMEYFINVNYIALIYNAVQVLLVYIYLSTYIKLKNKFSGGKLALLFWGEGALPELRIGSCLRLRNELSKETYMLTKQETLLARGAQVKCKRVREPWRTTLPHSLKFWVLWWWY